MNPLAGFIDSPFGKVYANGGVFLIDEVANGSPDLLTSLNYAIANAAIENPVTGERIVRHENQVFVAADNTWGDGANKKFARKRLDPAYLDRFRLGRVWIDHDRAITDAITAAFAEGA